MDNMFKNKQPDFIITIGASAGGLNAITEIVSQLPEDLNAAVFVVIHLSKVGLGDFLVHRLQKYTPFTCVIPKNKEKIESGHIYIAPPDLHLMVTANDEITLGLGPAENRWRPSIDVLCRSAAAHYTNRVIGIILTGYLNDGTAGMEAIKRSGGYCIVQDPNEAEYPDMPLSVLETMEVDYCVKLQEMGDTIEKIVETGKPMTPEEPQNDILKESEISENVSTRIENMDELGERVLTSCPDCGGGLWALKHNNIPRYRCHVGHSYSEKDLLLKQEEGLEATLWVALRIMEERRMLLSKISGEEKHKGLTNLGHHSEQKIKDLEKHIDKLKDLLFAVRED